MAISPLKGYKMIKDKKQIAAISAVMALISDDAVQIAYQAPVWGYPSHPWAAHGRATTMQYRDITQRRIIKRSR
jgi:hypothetical protein